MKSPGLETNSEAFDVQSPDLEITSPESAKSVRATCLGWRHCSDSDRISRTNSTHTCLHDIDQILPTMIHNLSYTHLPVSTTSRTVLQPTSRLSNCSIQLVSPRRARQKQQWLDLETRYGN